MQALMQQTTSSSLNVVCIGHSSMARTASTAATRYCQSCSSSIGGVFFNVINIFVYSDTGSCVYNLRNPSGIVYNNSSSPWLV